MSVKVKIKAISVIKPRVDFVGIYEQLFKSYESQQNKDVGLKQIGM